jgi:hypothetical protein
VPSDTKKNEENYMKFITGKSQVPWQDKMLRNGKA